MMLKSTPLILSVFGLETDFKVSDFEKTENQRKKEISANIIPSLDFYLQSCLFVSHLWFLFHCKCFSNLRDLEMDKIRN